jgi:molybdopterin-guanine dinucleotide biosynthesis protein A
MGGQPKALIPFGGRPLVQHIVGTLEKVVAGCLIVTNTPEWFAFLGRPMVADVVPHGGARGRSSSDPTRAATPSAVRGACDRPFRSPALLSALADRSTEAHGGGRRLAGRCRRSTPSLAGRACR